MSSTSVNPPFSLLRIAISMLLLRPCGGDPRAHGRCTRWDKTGGSFSDAVREDPVGLICSQELARRDAVDDREDADDDDHDGELHEREAASEGASAVSSDRHGRRSKQRTCHVVLQFETLAMVAGLPVKRKTSRRDRRPPDDAD